MAPISGETAMSPRAAEAEPEMTEEKPEEKQEMPESPEARDGVRRPTPLLLGPLLFGNDAEAPELPISPPTYCMAIPVHRTFIEFNCPERSPTGYHWAMHSAPASMAHDIRGDLEAEAAQVTYAHWGSYPTADDTIVAGPPGSARQGAGDQGSAASDEGPPAIRYRLSPTSAKASGYLLGSEVKKEPGVRNVPDSLGSTDDGEDCSGDEDEDVFVCPEYSEGAPLPSAGSAEHGEGSCRRCCFFPKGRCNNGYDCSFCHFAHEKRKPKNKKKSKHKKKNTQRQNMMAATGLAPFMVPVGVEFMGPNVHIVVDDNAENPQAMAMALIPVACYYGGC